MYLIPKHQYSALVESSSQSGTGGALHIRQLNHLDLQPNSRVTIRNDNKNQPLPKEHVVNDIAPPPQPPQPPPPQPQPPQPPEGWNRNTTFSTTGPNNVSIFRSTRDAGMETDLPRMVDQSNQTNLYGTDAFTSTNPIRVTDAATSMSQQRDNVTQTLPVNMVDAEMSTTHIPVSDQGTSMSKMYNATQTLPVHMLDAGTSTGHRDDVSTNTDTAPVNVDVATYMEPRHKSDNFTNTSPIMSRNFATSMNRPVNVDVATSPIANRVDVATYMEPRNTSNNFTNTSPISKNMRDNSTSPDSGPPANPSISSSTNTPQDVEPSPYATPPALETPSSILPRRKPFWLNGTERNLRTNIFDNPPAAPPAVTRLISPSMSLDSPSLFHGGPPVSIQDAIKPLPKPPSHVVRSRPSKPRQTANRERSRSPPVNRPLPRQIAPSQGRKRKIDNAAIVPPTKRMKEAKPAKKSVKKKKKVSQPKVVNIVDDNVVEFIHDQPAETKRRKKALLRAGTKRKSTRKVVLSRRSRDPKKPHVDYPLWQRKK
jgi:hypothetical protein